MMGQADVAIGTSVANRAYQETEGPIGFFIEELVIRADLGGIPTFREVVTQVRRTVLDAFAHQNVPFDQVVERRAPNRESGRSPLFQALFVWQNRPIAPLALPGVRGVYESSAVVASKVDITLNLRDTGPAIAGALLYNRDSVRGDDGRTARHLVRTAARPRVCVPRRSDRHGMVRWVGAGVAADRRMQRERRLGL